jgi:hypothetical protein
MTSPNDRPDIPPIPPDPAATSPAASAPAASAASATGAPSEPHPDAPSSWSGTDFKTTIEQGARTLDQRAEALGREAEAAAKRWGESPAVKETADLATRLWGLVLLAFGLWFLADVTLGLDLPNLRWSELWPIVLIVVGGFVVVRGLARRT